MIALIPVLFTAITYIPTLDNELTTWDDDKYLQENYLVHDLSLSRTKQIFSSYVWGNYHPITILSLAIENYFFGFDPFIYHFDNLLLHLCNTFLVFFLIIFINEKKLLLPAFITSILFGIHPMHVESVAWVAARKDLLYSMFYLAACLSYIFYLKKKEPRFILLTLGFFLFSLLSKAMAVTLPLTLVLIDYIYVGKIKLAHLTEKAYLFIISACFGMIAIHAQSSGGAMALNEVYNIFERVTLASSAIITYLYKLFIPVDLAILYPYPDKINNGLPFVYYIYFLLGLGVLTFFIFLSKKHRDFLFGTIFFFLHIILVTQLIAVGNSIVSERYTYLSYIGLFYILGVGLHWIVQKNKNLSIRIGLTGVMCLYFGILMATSWNRINIWENNLALYTDVIEKRNDITLPLNNRGNIFRDQGNYEQAIQDYMRAIESSPTFHISYHNLGYLYSLLDKADLALGNYNKAIELVPSSAKTYVTRAILFSKYNKVEKALADLNRAIELDPNMHLAYYQRALLLTKLKKYQLALNDFSRAMLLNPKNVSTYFNRGKLFSIMGIYDLALLDLNQAIKLFPQSGRIYLAKGITLTKKKDFINAIMTFNKGLMVDPKNAELYLNRGNAYNYLGNYDLAYLDYDRAILINPKLHTAYYNRGVIKYKAEKLDEALVDIDIALKLNPDYGEGYFGRSFVYQLKKEYILALNDALRASSLGYPVSKDYITKIQAELKGGT